MSQENVEVVRRVLEITQEGVGDPAAAYDKCVREGLLAPNHEWIAGRAAGLEDVVGREGYLQFTRIWTEDFEDVAVEIEEIVDTDSDRVVAITRFSGVGKGSRVPVEMRAGLVCTLDARRIARVVPFSNPDHALRAVGLSE